uniref:Uncharacterized protein n=1 Tax=Arundo donax TaxID=35708 RepID=A0A0A8XYA8_ARUDO
MLRKKVAKSEGSILADRVATENPNGRIKLCAHHGSKLTID